MAVFAQPVDVSLRRDKLRNRILNVALESAEFNAVLNDAAEEIVQLAKPISTEATIEGAFERILYSRLRDIGLQFHPEKEVGLELKRHLTRGRTDSRLGALIIEYKRPKLLSSAAEIDKAATQLENYLISLTALCASPHVGVLTNGLVIIEIRADRGHIVSRSSVEKLSGASLLRITRHFISLALTALTPANLIKDFCGSAVDGVVFRLSRILYSALDEAVPKTSMLYSEWKALFHLAHEDSSQQRRIQERQASLAELFRITIESHETDKEYKALFALHTAYAILLKFMAYRTVSDVYLSEPGQDFHSLASATKNSLQIFCNGLEDGEIFRDLMIINLLEGDFFSWYADKAQWSVDMSDAVKLMLQTLARYEEAGNIFEANDAPDVFRELYQAAVPRVVRSSLGEFYTPSWLAEHVIESAKPRGLWRAIDPCCGSGTFVVAAIARVRNECQQRKLDDAGTLKEILSRVAAIDLNPLGVLTTRINYFIHISKLLGSAEQPLVIPVYLGDAASTPDRITLEGVPCLRVELRTMRKSVTAILPVSLIQNTPSFMQVMLAYEQRIQAEDEEGARRLIVAAIDPEERKFALIKEVTECTKHLVELEKNRWNGIWARILSNFFTTACLGKFSIVMGNPPWIDWKNLPKGYRERIKSTCQAKGLFSGAGRTGGINLNVCALICYVSMTNWLEESGRLAFLMPRELINQASYEGWRRLGGQWQILELEDWSKAGHPFDPVKEDFMTYIIGKVTGKNNDIPVRQYAKKRGKPNASEWKTLYEARERLHVNCQIGRALIPNSTAITVGNSKEELAEYGLIAGECQYVGREGVEFYPQELLLFRFHSLGPRPGTVFLRNIQVSKSKFPVPQQKVLLETKYLHPLVKGPEIEPFYHATSDLLVAFPYDSTDPMRPVAMNRLRNTSPLLLRYYQKHRAIIDQQTKFSDKIRGEEPGEFYGLARTGPYSFAQAYVAFRDNSKWSATVITDAEVPWGGRTRYVFQNHAVSMCERKSARKFIDIDEAHFICSIFNTPVVERFIYATSDNRSFKVRPPVYIPEYDPQDPLHRQLAEESRKAHEDLANVEEARKRSNEVYLRLCTARRG